MKKLVFALVAFVGILCITISGCKKDKIFGGLSVDIPAADVILPPLSTLPIPIPLDTAILLPFPITQTFNLNDTMRAHTNGDFGASDVSSVVVKKISIDVMNPTATSNLSNFNSAILYLSSDANTTPIEVATLNFTSADYSTKVYETSNGAQICPYLTGSILNYQIKASLRALTTDTMRLSIKAVVQAK